MLLICFAVHLVHTSTALLLLRQQHDERVSTRQHRQRRQSSDKIQDLEMNSSNDRSCHGTQAKRKAHVGAATPATIPSDAKPAQVQEQVESQPEVIAATSANSTAVPTNPVAGNCGGTVAASQSLPHHNLPVARPFTGSVPPKREENFLKAQEKAQERDRTVGKSALPVSCPALFDKS